MFDTSSTRSPDQVEQELIETEQVIGRLRAHQFTLLQEAHASQVATADGCRTLAEWVAGRLDLSAATATTLVRSALLARERPNLTVALEGGVSSFDRAAATLRLADAGASEEVVERSRAHDLAGVDRLTAQHRRRSAARHAATHESRHLVLQPSLDEGAWRIWGLLPAADGHIIDHALTQRADELPTAPDQPRESRAARTADALTSICTDTITTGAMSGFALTVHADASVLADTSGEAGITLDRGLPAPMAVLDQALCEGTVELNVTAADGIPLAYGRTRRAIPPRLHRSILGRDKGCTADGCTSTYRLQAHHVTPWSEGGRTDPGNLTTLCWYHHHVVVHGRGFAIDPDSPPHRRRFTRLRALRDPP